MNHRPRILLVDNVPQDCEAVREYLEREGFSVSLVTTADEAKQLMATKQIDVSIIDLRLERDWDERDFSGITLAKQAERSIPKIIWTNHPTVEAVKQALGPALDGLPAAVGFVSKLNDEGLPTLLNSIRLALTPIDAPLTRRVLQAFQAEAPVALHNRVQEIGPEAAGERMQMLLRDMSQELERGRERESRQATQLHASSVAVSWVGIAAIVITLALLWFGETRIGLLSAAVTAITNVVQKLFTTQERAAQDRLTRSYKKLEEIYRATHLFAICDGFESQEARDTYRRKLLDHIIDQGWLFDDED
ncbi:MAG: two-component system, NtrC family, response regulator GlrR [Blastocatellia bacterium]|nr:two-component system, NtrC family, response regulator GlrR [Blastocatellia bacterium]